MRADSTRGLVVVVCAAQFMVMVDVAIVNVALPSIKEDLAFSAVGLQWVVNAYTLALAGFLMLGGRACDLFGQRRVFLAGLATFTAASLGCALAESSDALVAARAVQGLGGAIVSPASLAILATAFPAGHDRTRALGAWAAMSGFGGTVGVLLGGILTQAFGWPAVFLINLPLGLSVIAFGARLIAAGEPRDPARRFDLLGAVLVTAGLTMVVLGVIRSEALDWGATGVLGPLAGGLALLGLFALHEWRWAADPLMPPRVLRNPLLRASNVIVILLFSGAFSVWYFLSLFLQQVRGLDALQAGLAFVPLTVCVLAGTMLAPRAIRRFGVRPVLCLGLLATGSGLVMLTAVEPGGAYATHVLPGGLLATLGLGFALVGATIAALEGGESGEAGLASGILNTSRLVGGSLGLAVFSALAASRTGALAADGASRLSALADGYATAFLAGGIASLAAAGLAALLVRTSSGREGAALDRAEA